MEGFPLGGFKGGDIGIGSAGLKLPGEFFHFLTGEDEGHRRTAAAPSSFHLHFLQIPSFG